ncbi:MAG: hypothetical protein MPI95_05835 [Nitrosopumilus sp.]|nr:hypothetical protein [Nitrosopumilus sp.]CAI9831746.1 conserved hypothetical protein [Nitrosopumilaceae archaeon]MDA7941525.1 hypothetical protein [Nitrosopumilus sp.]MDA7943333.1 hypothetical protein [Nitrosopumilus sp.]MDA7944781.1 hypothetical protein [Nitrosopumilus sp.]
MIEEEDAGRVAGVAAGTLAGAAKDKASFARLPDKYWGYYARGHDAKGAFGVILAYSEDEGGIDDLLRMYEEWVRSQK